MLNLRISGCKINTLVGREFSGVLGRAPGRGDEYGDKGKEEIERPPFGRCP